MLKTNTKKYRANVRKYILESIPEEMNDGTDKEKLDALKAEFERTAGFKYNLQKFPNIQNRLADWLMGLPTHLEYAYFNILQKDKELREYTEDLTAKAENKLLETYWNFMAYQIIRIW